MGENLKPNGHTLLGIVKQRDLCFITCSVSDWLISWWQDNTGFFQATSERKCQTWCWKRWVTQSWKMDFPFFFISTDPTQSVYFISCCVPVNKNCKVTHDSLRAKDFILKNRIFFLSSHQPSLCQSSLCLQCLGLPCPALPAALVFSKLHFVKQ